MINSNRILVACDIFREYFFISGSLRIFPAMCVRCSAILRWNSSKILNALGPKCYFCLYINQFRICSIHDIRFDFSSDFNNLGLTVANSEVAFLLYELLTKPFNKYFINLVR